MHSFNQSTNNNLRQRYLFSQTPLTAVQYYAIPSPPPLLLGPFPLSETPQTIFVLPASLPDFVPRTILQSATNSTNLQKSATAAIARSGQASRTTHALPTAANTQPYAKKLSKTSMHNENNELIRDFRKAPPAQAAPSKKVPCKHFAAPLPSSSFSKPLSGLKSNFSTSLPVSREQSRQKFKGEVEVSKQGKREIILYRISGSSEVYSFKVISTNENIKNCICRECWKWWDKYTSIKVNGTDFLSDPCELDHRCSPKKRVKSKMEKKPEKKVQKKPLPVKEKKLSAAMEMINMIKEWDLGVEMTKELIDRTIREDEKLKQKRREYRQRKKAEKENMSKLLDESYVQLAKNSSRTVQEVDEYTLEGNDEERQLSPMEVLDVMTCKAADDFMDVLEVMSCEPVEDANCIYID